MADRKITKEKGTAAAKTGKAVGAKKSSADKKGSGRAGAGERASKGKGAASAKTAKKTAAEKDFLREEEPLSTSMKEEIALAVTLLISLLFFLSYINLCGSVGKWLNTLVFGLTGIFGYLFPFLLFFGVAFFISNRRNRVAKRKLICAVAFFICLAALVELLSTYDAERKLGQFFTVSAEGKSGGGILGGILVFLLVPLFDTVATTVILFILMIICLMIVTGKELFAFLRSVAGTWEEESPFSKRGGGFEEEAFLEEYAQEADFAEQIEPKRRVVFQKSGKGAGVASGDGREVVCFVDALKARGKKSLGDTPDVLAFDEQPAADAVPVPQEDKSRQQERREMEPDEIAGITITGEYRSEEPLPENNEIKDSGTLENSLPTAFLEEELKRKFGDQDKERVFYDVNVSEHGTTVKENDVVLIRKDWFGDEEPLIPQRAGDISGSVADRNIQNKPPVNGGEKTAAKEEYISADMIFASAGIDPVVPVPQPKKEEPAPGHPTQHGISISKNNVPSDAFWPDMSAETEGERVFGGIRISGAPKLPLGDVSEKQIPAGDKESVQKETVQEEFLEEPLQDDLILDGIAVNREETPAQKIWLPDRCGDLQKLETPPRDSVRAASRDNNKLFSADMPLSRQTSGQNTAAVQIPMKEPAPVQTPEKKYEFPSTDLLAEPKPGRGMNERELKETAEKLQNTLQSFGVRVTVSNISCGPAVTQYELKLEQGVKVNQITKLSDDIKLNLAATDIRIEAPIPGKAAVGIEVPNKENSPVVLRELLDSAEFKKHKSKLAFAVGKNISGQIVVSDIAKMPHMLIAGATGSGKSVCINTIIMSILYKADPKEVKLIMVDPKVVELSVYNGIPHLLIPVVTDPKKASAALSWAVSEMTDRYQKFAELSVRDLVGYNAKVDESERLPQIVIIVDELADLMMVASANEVEDAICRLAQMARAAGIYLIIATQRPSVNVITGVIKANVPSRVAFSVTSAVDSRTILDGVGAERLLGKGDMLFFPSGYPKPVRIQGAFVSDTEVSKVVEFIKGQYEGMQGYNEEVSQRIQNATSAGGGSMASGNDDYFEEAGRYIIEKQKASIGLLQRVYKLGFNRAARIMDQLMAAGVVGAEEGTKPRKILMTLTEFEEYLRR